jgi:hypothetical protein
LTLYELCNGQVEKEWGLRRCLVDDMHGMVSLLPATGGIKLNHALDIWVGTPLFVGSTTSMTQ